MVALHFTAPRHSNRPRFDAIRTAARGRWPGILSEIIGPDWLTGRNGPCPGCGGRDRFQFNRKSEAGAFSCRGHEHGGGDGFALIQHVTGGDFPSAARLVAEVLGMAAVDSGNRQEIAPPPMPPAEPARDWLKAKESAARMWHEAKQITAADPAGRYLARRGLSLPDRADALRHHPALAYWAPGDQGGPEFIGRLPALLCLIQKPDGSGAGLHRIYMEADGRKFEHAGHPAKKLFKAGELAGAAVRLAMPADDRLGIAEGVETALAFATASGVPSWSALSSSLLPSVWLPESIRRVYIAVDPDEAGRRAADRLAARLTNEGRTAWLCEPPGGIKGDWNDWLLSAEGGRHAA